MSSKKSTSSTSSGLSNTTKFKQFNFDKRGSQQHTKITMPLSHYEGYNLWLLKATHLNRGRGIHVFNSLEELKKLIKEYCVGKEMTSPTKKPGKEKEEDSTPVEESSPPHL